MKISLCVIAKDEEREISKLLESTKDIVDEIIVVDTGSKDKTMEIGRSYNAKIIQSEWKKDFAYHRNESIKNAIGDWILFLDCDEILEKIDKEKIHEILEKNINIKGYNLSIINIIDNKEIARFEALRLFKREEGIYFEGSIHEQVSLSITRKYGEEVIKNLECKVYHYGYEPEIIKSKNKIKRNLEILEAIKEKTSYIYSMIGDEYLKDSNLPKAIVNYEMSFNYNIPINNMVAVNYITALINNNETKKAIEFIEKIKKKNDRFRDLYFLEFWIYRKNKNKVLAKKAIENYIRITEDGIKYEWVKNFENIYNLKEMRKCLDL